MKTDMKHINTLAAAVFLAAVLSSCAKMRVETEDVRPAGTPIRMAVSSEGAQTKALFDAASFSAEGNVLQIWDVYFNSVVAPQAYIEGTNVVSTGTDAVWPFKDGDDVLSPGKHYYWTKTGTHRFYGVLVKDNSRAATPLTAPSDWGFDAAVYNVPTTKLTLDSPQFDFVYSNVIERNLDNGDPTTAVPLKFNHLFSAFGFTFENDSPSSFNIKSATLKVNDQAAATIDYSNVWDKGFAPADAADNWNPAVTYTGLTMSSTAGISGKTGEIQPATCYDMFQGGKITDMANYDKYTLIWPQDLTGKTLEMKYLVSGKRYQEVDVTVNKYTYTTSYGSDNYDVSFTDNLNYVTSSGDKSFDYNKEGSHYVYVGRGKGSFAVRSAYKRSWGYYTRSTITDKETQLVDYTEEKTVTKNLKDLTPGGTWLAGNRYLYKLVFSDNEVNLVVSVMKWEDGHGGNVTFQ